jgi:6-phosphogluconolactonase
MPLRILDDPGAVADAAADDVLTIGRAALAARSRFLIALSGGSTPRAMHARLGSDALRGGLDWHAVEFFWSDERAVAAAHPDSNFGMARATLLDPLGIGGERVHRMRGEAPDLDEAAAEYERDLSSVTGSSLDGPPPPLDLVLLGMGADGHTASLFPYTPALDARGRWVVANPVPQLATRRLTFTFDMITAAREIRVLVAGADKAPALSAVWTGSFEPERYPSQRLSQDRSRAVWLVDRTAAGQLRQDAAGLRV